MAESTLSLKYRKPFDWDSLLATFKAHQLPGLESVSDEFYERIFHLDRRTGYFRVAHGSARRGELKLTLYGASEQATAKIAARVRRMFDLDLDPAEVAVVMHGQPHLGDAWSKHPGLRVARTWDRFETLITTVLGQLVSVNFGRTLIHELMQGYGNRVKHPVTGQGIPLFPAPKVLQGAGLLDVRTSVMRRTAIRGLASAAVDGTLPLNHDPEPKALRRTLLALPGIGAWTAEYVAMRAFDDNDAFPATDYGLKQEILRHPEMNVNAVRPWRAYAAVALWKDFVARKGMPYEPVV
ncbi:MAG TPA: AlkA N-terminal domain-containing protein [Acidobacteriaceae bacterium]|jgi:3-methyladenine DNA glycosylase/8-oxoguanine DNA glycosylase